jgi:glycerol kinase
MHKDWKKGADQTVLRIDGGMVASDWTMQRLADLLDAPVDRPTILETTALGAAWLAGSRAGVWPQREEFAKAWACDRQFVPGMDGRTRSAKLKGWRDAVRRTLSAG